MRSKAVRQQYAAQRVAVQRLSECRGTNKCELSEVPAKPSLAFRMHAYTLLLLSLIGPNITHDDEWMNEELSCFPREEVRARLYRVGDEWKKRNMKAMRRKKDREREREGDCDGLRMK